LFAALDWIFGKFRIIFRRIQVDPFGSLGRYLPQIDISGPMLGFPGDFSDLFNPLQPKVPILRLKGFISIDQ